jgi:acyl-ACP thioesterase
VLDTTIPRPANGRAYSASRSVRLSDMSASGRLRLDAVARLLQDVAIDDVQETGWGMPEHLWFVRSIRIDVHEPIVGWGELELTTWCSGVAAIAAGRRWSIVGDAGGRIEVDSVWIHLDAAASPARIGEFGVYGEAAQGRPVSTKLELEDPTAGSREPWPLRTTDVDLHGHVNNAVYWQAVEHAVPARERAYRAELDYRRPIDLGDALELVVSSQNGSTVVGFAVGTDVRAVARVGPI